MKANHILYKDMLESLRARGLSPKHAVTMGLEPLTKEETKRLKGVSIPGNATKIPYYSPQGKPTGHYRLRYMGDVRSGFEKLAGVKQKRYTQPLGSKVEIYWTPGHKWPAFLADPTTPLTITEGEFKAACATYHGMPTIGLGGVRSYVQDGKFHPELEAVTWAGRKVIILYDSDAAANADVCVAEGALAKELTARGAEVYIGRLPPAKDGTKQGLDDFIAAHGMDALATLLESPTGLYAWGPGAALHAFNERCLMVLGEGGASIYERATGHTYNCTRAANEVFAHMMIDVDAKDAKGNIITKQVPLVPTWIKWPMRALVVGRTFAPGQPPITDDNKLNTWKGWAVKESEVAPGNMKPWHKLLKHLFGDDDAARTWFEQWAAYPIQHPGTKLTTACVLWGLQEGTGKTLLGHMLMELYGEHGTEIGDVDLEDNRMEWAADMQFAIADDITGAESKYVANKLKTMITQNKLRINKKYVPSYTVPDCINYYFTSNDPNALALSTNDRRYFVHEVKAGPLPEADVEEIMQWRRERKGVLFHYLQHLDLEGFDPSGRAPMTQAKVEMAHYGRSDLQQWCLDLSEDPDTLLGGLRGDLFTPTELLGLYDREGVKRTSVNAMGRALKVAGFSMANVFTLKGVYRMYAIRNKAKWAKATAKAKADHFLENRGPIKAVKALRSVT